MKQKEITITLEKENIKGSLVIEIKKYLEELEEIQGDPIFERVKHFFDNQIVLDSILINAKECTENETVEVKSNKRVTFAVNYKDKKKVVNGFLWLWIDQEKTWFHISTKNTFSIVIKNLEEKEYLLVCYPLDSAKRLDISEGFKIYTTEMQEATEPHIIQHKGNQIKIEASLRIINQQIEKEVKKSYDTEEEETTYDIGEGDIESEEEVMPHKTPIQEQKQNSHSFRYKNRRITIYYPTELTKEHFFKLFNQLMVQDGTIIALLESNPDLEEIKLQ